MRLTIHEALDGTDIAAHVRRGIQQADPTHVGQRDWQPLTLSLHDEQGALCGGLYGASMWGWLMIDGLWVDAAHRGHGHGARLLGVAEDTARARGCRGVSLGTFDFQARAFYERQGYTVYGELPDFPPGHAHLQLAKRLDH